MKKALIAVIPGILIVGVFVLPVIADETLAKFKGGIGLMPAPSGQGTDATATTVNRNIVRGVQPSGQVRVISDGVAKDEREDVDEDPELSDEVLSFSRKQNPAGLHTVHGRRPTHEAL